MEAAAGLPKLCTPMGQANLDMSEEWLAGSTKTLHLKGENMILKEQDSRPAYTHSRITVITC